MKQSLTGNPKALAGLTDELSYTIQNKSDHIIYVETASTKPIDGEGAFELEPREFGVVKKPPGSEVYVWTAPQIDEGIIVYDEEA